MEITFLKDHLDNKAEDTVTVSDDLGNYLIRCNVAVEKTQKFSGSRSKTPVPPVSKPPRYNPEDDEFDL